MPFGGENQQMRGWSRRKLEYLRSYVSAYLKATTRALHRYYIDGFAGPGRLPDEQTGEMVDGSPLIALSAKDPSFTACFLIEANPDTYTRLRENAEGYPHARLHLGDCNDIIPQIMSDIHPKAPTLVVLDPTGVVGQVRWATIETIARWRTEIFLTFPYHMAVQRLLPNQHEKLTNEMADKLDVHLPPGWRPVYEQCVGRDRRFLARGLLDLCRKRLRELGYPYVFGSSVFKTDAGLPLYYLIWAGRCEVGANIAKHVVYKQFHPQIRLLRPEDDWLA